MNFIILLSLMALALGAPTVTDDTVTDPMPTESAASSSSNGYDLDILVFQDPKKFNPDAQPSPSSTISSQGTTTPFVSISTGSSVFGLPSSTQVPESSSSTLKTKTKNNLQQGLVKIQTRIRMDKYGAMDHTIFMNALQNYFPYMSRYALEATPLSSDFKAADITFSLLVPSEYADQCLAAMSVFMLDIMDQTFDSKCSRFLCQPAIDSIESDVCLAKDFPWTQDHSWLSHSNKARILFGILAIMFVIGLLLYILSLVFARRSRFVNQYAEFQNDGESSVEVHPITTMIAGNSARPNERPKTAWAPPNAKNGKGDHLHLVIFDNPTCNKNSSSI